MKICNICKVAKALDHYSKASRHPDGLQYRCKECMKEYRLVNIERLQKQRSDMYMQNRETRLAALKVYRDKNPDVIKARKAKYYKANVAATVNRVKKWRIENPERNAELARVNAKRQRRKNPGMASQHARERDATKLNATPKWANRAKMVEFYKSAHGLNMLLGEWHHVDHIVPLRSPLVCGLHNEFNLQILPEKENLRKSNRYWPDMPSSDDTL